MQVSYTNELDFKTLTFVILSESNKDATLMLLPEVVRALYSTEELLKPDGFHIYYSAEAKVIIHTIGGKEPIRVEKLRRTLHTCIAQANNYKAKEIQILCKNPCGQEFASAVSATLGEIPVLSNYQFIKYLKDKDKAANSLEKVGIYTDIQDTALPIESGYKVASAACRVRDLVNEPPNILTSVALANYAKEMGNQFGFKVEVFDKPKIEELKMGGLLAVNRGSQDPPTFSIMEWKPANATNTKPIVLVGKGLVYDTGGLSLKPTAGSMDSMKSDMAGGGVVIGTMCALADNNIPRHVIGLVPSTDNRPGENAYTPNDVITMYDGTTVEVLNTDAEGRMILADALSWAKQYDPALVIDLATLTGSAVMAIGTIAAVLCGTADDTTIQRMIQSGTTTGERLVQLPIWEEYKEQLKSDIADMKNIGSRYAGAITAAKFLEHFTGYPWIHLDIAGPSYLDAPDSYRGKNGTGFGVRLLYDFISNFSA